jgi:hypothetical protein
MTSSLTSRCATAQLFVVGRIFIEVKEKEKEKQEKYPLVKREALWLDTICNIHLSAETNVRNATH